MTQGMKYTELRPTICINIVDFILFPGEEDFHNVGVVMNKKIGAHNFREYAIALS